MTPAHSRWPWPLRASLLVLAALIIVSLVADLLPGGPTLSGAHASDVKLALERVHAGGGWVFFGWWARGARASVATGVLASLLGLGCGAVLAAAAAFGPRFVDALVTRFVELSSTLPAVIALALAYTLLGRRLEVLVAVVAWVRTAEAARVLRGRLLQVLTEDFVSAVIALGASPTRILVRHVVPHLSSAAAVSLFSGAAAAIGLESAAGFIGLSPHRGLPSWGEALGRAPGLGHETIALAAGAGIAASMGSLWVVARRLAGRPRVAPRNLG